MTGSVLITKTRHNKKRVRRRTLSQKVQMGSVSLIVILSVIIGFVSLFYLAHNNSQANKGNDFTNLRVKRKEIIYNIEEWERKISEVQTIDNLVESKYVADMVKPNNGDGRIKYIRGDTGIASTMK